MDENVSDVMRQNVCVFRNSPDNLFSKEQTNPNQLNCNVGKEKLGISVEHKFFLHNNIILCVDLCS